MFELWDGDLIANGAAVAAALYDQFVWRKGHSRLLVQ